ncbi:MarR family transcriptional regulator [Trinickia symbiotica]|uniref:MarR family transcriptional regulator n=1 Tax=Trinickia symbiotica TaxID=863227 RepID=A0A2T3XUI7_9BURK|nr:HTH domain-containing protein [Trinickia symbiotica]PTB20171.1 MarR family transcriptional regulator [Trinickia symbiotica]
MSKTQIGTGTEAEFFARGKRLARQADRGERLVETRIVTFENPAEVAQLLTQARIGVFRAIKSEPASITGLAARLHRDRSAVKRDIDALQAAGLVLVETAANPGHGTQKVVRAVASRVDLHVLID